MYLCMIRGQVPLLTCLTFFYFMEPENLQEFTNVLRGRFYNVMDFYSLIGW